MDPNATYYDAHVIAWVFSADIDTVFAWARYSMIPELH